MDGNEENGTEPDKSTQLKKKVDKKLSMKSIFFCGRPPTVNCQRTLFIRAVCGRVLSHRIIFRPTIGFCVSWLGLVIFAWKLSWQIRTRQKENGGVRRGRGVWTLSIESWNTQGKNRPESLRFPVFSCMHTYIWWRVSQVTSGSTRG